MKNICPTAGIQILDYEKKGLRLFHANKFWPLWAPGLLEVIGGGNARAQTGGIWKTGTIACSSQAVSF